MTEEEMKIDNEKALAILKRLRCSQAEAEDYLATFPKEAEDNEN